LLSFTLEQTTRAEMNPARAESREDNRVPPRTAANYHYGFRFLGELSARWEDQHAPEAKVDSAAPIKACPRKSCMTTRLLSSGFRPLKVCTQ
jgi:hypothetical protein